MDKLSTCLGSWVPSAVRRSAGAAAVVVLAALLIGAGAAGQDQELAARLEQARLLVQKGAYAELLALTNQLAAIHPRESEVFRYRGQAKRALKDLAGAVADYSRAIDLDPRNTKAWRGRAATRLEAKQPQEALRDVNQAITLAPDEENGYVIRADIRGDLKDYRGAIADLDRALRIAPSSSLDYVRRAYFKDDAGDLAGAEADLTRALELNPKEGIAWANRGDLRRKTSNYKGSNDDITEAIALGYNLAQSHYGRALTLEKDGSFPQAIDDARQCLSIQPGHVQATNLIERVKARLTAIEDARRAAEEDARRADERRAEAGRGKPAPVTPGRALPVLTFSASDPCAAADSAPTALMPWSPAGGAVPVATPVPASVVATAVPATAFSSFTTTMTKAHYNGAVSVAMEGMRLLYGPLPPEQERAFEAAWTPLYDHPTPEIQNYLGRLSPLLGRFLSSRETWMRASAAVEAAMMDASLGVAAATSAGWLDGMARADQQALVLSRLEAEMADTAKAIQALGNPPNPLAAKCAASRQYHRSLPKPESVLDGEWVSADGKSRMFYQTLKRYPDGKALLYSYSYAFADQLRASGRGAARPGVDNARDGGLIAVPGLEDVLILVVQEPGAILWASPLGIGVTFDGYFLDGDRLRHIVYGPRALGSNQWVFSGTTYVRAPRLTDTMPLLPGHTWPDVQAVATKYEQERLNNLAARRQNFSPQVKALVSVDPENLPGAPAAGQPQNDKQRQPDTAGQAGKAKAGAFGLTPDELRETTDFHDSMIKLLERTLAKEQDDLRRETDSDRRKSLQFRVLQLQSNIQAEHDLLASYQTGTLVHTRSAFDVFAQQQFIGQVKQEAWRSDQVRRTAAGIERQIELLPEEMRPAMRAKAHAILDPATLARGDVERAKRLAGAINEQVQGYWLGQAAREDEKAIDAQESEFWAQMAILATSACVVGLGQQAMLETFGETAAITVWSPYVLGGLYSGTTGFIAGGLSPSEGVKGAVAGSSALGTLVVEFLDGYRRKAADPKATWQDAAWEGAQQAGPALLLQQAMQVGAKFLVGGAVHVFGKDSRMFRPVVLTTAGQQRLDALRLVNAVHEGQGLVDEFQRAQRSLLEVRVKNPGSPECARLEADAKRLAAALNSTYHGKWLLKYRAHRSVQRAFDGYVQTSYDEMMPEMRAMLQAQGYSLDGVEFKQLRNASSAGSAGMDLDLALKERPGMVIRRNGKSVSLQEFQRDAQRALNQSYKKVTGYSAQRSELNLTTSVHGEAYSNPALLEKNFDFTALDERDLKQIGKVLGVKLDKIANDPVMTAIAKVQASSRESSKDIRNLLLPMLRQKAAKAPGGSSQASLLQADIGYWERMLGHFSEAGTEATDPMRILELDRTLRQDTGGRGIMEVVQDLTKAFAR